VKNNRRIKSQKNVGMIKEYIESFKDVIKKGQKIPN
jgi:hypothetical protein